MSKNSLAAANKNDSNGKFEGGELDDTDLSQIAEESGIAY